MGDEDHEAANWLTLLGEAGERQWAHEPPMTSDDMTGGPKPSENLIARKAWAVIDTHTTPTEPMPDWIVAYLKRVARRIDENLEPSGALKREGAHAALGITGTAPPEVSPDVRVYLTMQRWIDDPESPEVTGPKAAACRYIEERHPEDRQLTTGPIIQKYKRGKRVWEAES